jgi:hypothetical protein
LRLGTFAPSRSRNCLFQVERRHEPELGFSAGDGGVRVGLQFPQTLLDEGFSASGQRSVIWPLVMGQLASNQRAAR